MYLKCCFYGTVFDIFDINTDDKNYFFFSVDNVLENNMTEPVFVN